MHHRTFRAIKDPQLILEKLDVCAKELEEDLERTDFAGYTVTLKLKLDVSNGSKNSEPYVTDTA
jgi:hypothetical protein